MKNRVDAGLRERIGIGRGGGVGGDLIPSRDFVSRSPAGNDDGQQCGGKRVKESAWTRE